MNINFDELTIENIGTWPNPVKMVTLAIVFVLIMVGGYWFDTRAQIQVLKKVEFKERELKQTFEIKQHRAANLIEYSKQLEDMRKTFGALLHQLPSESEVPGLLEDISQSGIASGLEFKLFKPLPEKQLDFYSELPINITVIGDFHQLAAFVSSIASLDRIVTLHDFTIRSEKTKKPAGSNDGRDLLTMQITAKTYRYTGETDEANDAAS